LALGAVADFGERQCPTGHDGQERGGRHRSPLHPQCNLEKVKLNPACADSFIKNTRFFPSFRNYSQQKFLICERKRVLSRTFGIEQAVALVPENHQKVSKSLICSTIAEEKHNMNTPEIRNSIISMAQLSL
jgi:hypothetical protein